MNATEVISALRIHYGAGYRLVEQVADHTGLRASRWLDVMAFGLWPSRGLEIHGIEVKVSRTDFRREMERPEKAEATAVRCDRFFVAAPAGLVDPLVFETVAPAWGLLEVHEDRTGKRTVRTTRKAELTAAKPVDRDFLAAILRRLPSPTDELRAEVRAEVERETEALIAESVEREVGRTSHEAVSLRESVAAFEAASGVRLADFNSYGFGGPEALGRAIRLLVDEMGGWQSARGRLTIVQREARSRGENVTAAAERVGELVAALDDVFGGPTS